jgi:hypothetical protein
MSNRRRKSREKGGLEAKPVEALTAKEATAELKVPRC